MPEEKANPEGDVELLDAARGAQAGAGTRLDLSEAKWLVNPGSVGQPRDGDPRAAWLELDTEGWEATYHRVDYEIDRAAEAITAANLPAHLARRLYAGQ
jgi:diadenosine tetraphosphatase ApaH/serine/threonine PP2A family protein phosphatase